jgi:hypothetical protein
MEDEVENSQIEKRKVDEGIYAENTKKSKTTSDSGNSTSATSTTAPSISNSDTTSTPFKYKKTAQFDNSDVINFLKEKKARVEVLQLARYS